MSPDPDEEWEATRRAQLAFRRSGKGWSHVRSDAVRPWRHRGPVPERTGL